MMIQLADVAIFALLGVWIKKTVSVIVGLLAVLGAFALMTWSVSDPSFTFDTNGLPKNWLGFWGASFSDLSIQFLGLAAVTVIIPPIFWSIFSLINHPLSQLWSRLIAWVFALIAWTIFAAGIKVPERWPLSVGLGGVVGDLILSILPNFLESSSNGVWALVFEMMLGLTAVLLTIRACDLRQIILGKNKKNNQTNISLIGESYSLETRNFDEKTDNNHEWRILISAPIGQILHCGYSTAAILRYTFRRNHHTLIFNSHNLAESEPYSSIDFDKNSPPDYTDYTVQTNDEIRCINDWDSCTQPFSESHIHSKDKRYDSILRTKRENDISIQKNKTVGSFQLPFLSLLRERQKMDNRSYLSNETIDENAKTLQGVLEDFGIKGQIIKVYPGPVVTLYELELAPGVKSSRVISLSEDIARSMSSVAARVAIVPGRNVIGIELPNKQRETVYLREQLSSLAFRESKAKLGICLGKTIGGEPIVVDLTKMPHLLVAGTTGSGKSVAINTMILSLLYRMLPQQCKFIMIDPKMLELSIYDGIPHLLSPVVVDPQKAVVALKWTIREMEERYKKMSKLGVRNINGFNARVEEARQKGEIISRTLQTGFDHKTGEPIYETEEIESELLPFIVVVIDEMADLMMVAGKDIEGAVQRLAQMARAAGIHVIMATQRPSVDVITGTIKANFPNRISFQVTSKIDSRTILGEMGAEQLLGMGDMLYMTGGGRITRIHGPFVDDNEVENIVNHLKSQGVPQYLESITEEDEDSDSLARTHSAGNRLDITNNAYDQAVAIVLRDRKVSISYIQRRMSIGYNRAASIIERMEKEGLISSANDSGKREILVSGEK
ncbi:FtsK/SpoIIIE family DNA translocase [Candidatus Endowatersipora endosymbiont of Watersipora subatra]|uniref:FtsK/SpoIIIE family DNA translocase n=1 Tax=Candidatus Endowatersipora endosymbiont of Watersipora subatra TaxID=3077946 RepID=UPI00312CB895